MQLVNLLLFISLHVTLSTLCEFMATDVVICILLLSMISFGHSCRLSGITNI
jgi:hypothetical protein